VKTDTNKTKWKLTPKTLDKEVFEVLNRLRTNPKSFIPQLQKELTWFESYSNRYQGTNKINIPGGESRETAEGPSVWREAIKALESQPSLPAFEWRDGIALACQDQCKDLGPEGFEGNHSFNSGVTFRCEAHGTWGEGGFKAHMVSGVNEYVSEAISYGRTKAEDIVLEILIDDGDCKKYHRNALLNTSFKVCGVASGDHKKHKTMCVVAYAN
jgi:uncharacterized protein YkwD